MDREKIENLVKMAFVARRPETCHANVAEAIYVVADALFRVADEMKESNRLRSEWFSRKCGEEV